MSKEKGTILYVDDEQDNLDVFESNYFKEYNIITANSAQEALDIIVEKDIHVLISDYRMPLKSGIDLFEDTIKIRPDIPRILLTGYKDFDIVQDSINKGKIYHCILKPWTKQEVTEVIEKALEDYWAGQENKKKLTSLLQSNARLAETSQLLLSQTKIQSEELREFENITSHQLKSPLRSIAILVDILIQDYAQTLGGELGESLALIKNRMTLMTGLMDDLIEYNKIGLIDLNKNNKCDPHQLIENILDELEIGQRKINISIDTPSLPLHQYLIQTILFQLISNSIQFTDSEKGQIDILIEKHDKFVNICINDNGQGMNENFIPQVFSLFKSTISSSEHTGIGLALVKKIINLYNGKVKIASTVNTGTKVTCKIPI